MNRFIQYLRFLFKSTNEHGVHSPFVYDLVTRAFYTKEITPKHSLIKELNELNFLSKKDLKTLNNSFHHLYGNNTPLSCLILTNRHLKSNDKEYDVIFVDPEMANPNMDETVTLLNKTLSPQGVIIVKSPGESKFWQHLTEQEIFHCTINTYSLGFIFKRTEQRKQDFVIRN